MTRTEAAVPAPRRHSLGEDIYGLVTGSLLIAVGLTLMKASGIVTAGMAGVALLISYEAGWTVEGWFWILNLPFFILALGSLGRAFAIKSIAAVTLVSLGAALTRTSLEIASIHPAFGAVAGGTAAGTGILALLRHGAGVGGVTILAAFLQKKFNWSVGWLSFLLDGTIIAVAVVAIPSELALYSILSVAAVSGILIAYHKPGRYTGY